MLLQALLNAVVGEVHAFAVLLDIGATGLGERRYGICKADRLRADDAGDNQRRQERATENARLFLHALSLSDFTVFCGLLNYLNEKANTVAPHDHHRC
ncbi:hypothetical protein [Rhizobium cauense]|uniref:hypothetical protein n=1 Tax=Rhizobium cauense TaxID=1166683 RepID=UPI003B83A0F9